MWTVLHWTPLGFILKIDLLQKDKSSRRDVGFLPSTFRFLDYKLTLSGPNKPSRCWKRFQSLKISLFANCSSAFCKMLFFAAHVHFRLGTSILLHCNIAWRDLDYAKNENLLMCGCGIRSQLIPISVDTINSDFWKFDLHSWLHFILNDDTAQDYDERS
jgi:hypothetical protein